MSLQFEINQQTLNNQIDVLRKVIRLPKLQPSQKHSLAELLKMLYALKRELLEDEMASGKAISLAEFLETESYK